MFASALMFANNENMLMEPRCHCEYANNGSGAAAFTSPQDRNRKTHLNATSTDAAVLSGLVWSCKEDKSIRFERSF